MLNIFSGASLPFGIPQVRILCSVLSPIPNGREAPEKMFNILNHQGNANQNNPEIPPHISQNG
jgi:hypothetical protein